MSKKNILEYLEENMDELRSLFPNLISAEYVAKPPRLLIKVDEEVEKPVIVYKDKKIPISLEVVELSLEEKAHLDWQKRHPGAGLAQGKGFSITDNITELPSMEQIKVVKERVK